MLIVSSGWLVIDIPVNVSIVINVSQSNWYGGMG